MNIFELVGDTTSNNIEQKLAILEGAPDKRYWFIPAWEDSDVKDRMIACLAATPRLRSGGEGAEQIKVRFSWEAVLLFGSKQQQQAFNRFRTEYVEYLVNRYCTTTTNCEARLSGTSAKNFPMSDIDYNFEGSGMKLAIDNIKKEHTKYFGSNNTLDDVFDANLYGTTFKFAGHKGYVLSPLDDARQCVWAFSRTAEVIKTISSKERDVFEKALHDSHRKMFKCATRRLSSPDYSDCNCETQRFDMYARRLTEFVAQKQSTQGSFSSTMESMSRAKVFEHETYRTFGAILHIVEGCKRKDVTDARFFHHSVLDNFGFVVQAMCKRLTCKSDDDINTFVYRVQKASKYIDRICDGLLQIDGDKKRRATWTNISRASRCLNEARRTHAQNESLKQARLQDLLSALNWRWPDTTLRMDFLVHLYRTLIECTTTT